jgi:hypothetical protein
MNRIFKVLLALCLLLSLRSVAAQPDAAPVLLGDITASQDGFNAGVAANLLSVTHSERS